MIFTASVAFLSVCAVLVFIFHFRKPAIDVSSALEDEAISLIRREGLSLETLATALDLSDHQVKRMKPIFNDEKTKRNALLRKYPPLDNKAAEDELKKQLELFHKYYEDMYSHILNEEQFSKFMRIRSKFQQ